MSSRFPRPKKGGLVELILQVGVGQLTEQHKDTLVRQLAALLNVLDLRHQGSEDSGPLRPQVLEPHSQPDGVQLPSRSVSLHTHLSHSYSFFFFSSKGSSKGMI